MHSNKTPTLRRHVSTCVIYERKRTHRRMGETLTCFHELLRVLPKPIVIARIINARAEHGGTASSITAYAEITHVQLYPPLMHPHVLCISYVPCQMHHLVESRAHEVCSGLRQRAMRSCMERIFDHACAHWLVSCVERQD